MEKGQKQYQKMTDLPASLTQVTADWLEKHFREAGHEIPHIQSYSHKPMEGFTGAMGEVGIFTIEWDEDPGFGIPETFVAKCPLDDDIARMYNEVMQFYIREYGFYSDLSSEVDMRIPNCWINEYDQETGRAFLLLEYLGQAEKGDILHGCSVDVMRTLIEDLAKMHGKFWMNERLLEIPWLIDWTAESLKLGIDITRQSWMNLAEREPERYPKDLFKVLEETWVYNTDEWLDRYASLPWTLTHMDYELDNVLIDEQGPIVLDWQSVMRSHPGVDLAWLLAASHTPDTLEVEGELLDLYRETLLASGGPNWSSDDLEQALAWGILYPVSCQAVPYLQDTSAYGEGAARMRRRFEKFLQGSIDAAIRWNLVGHLQPLI